MTRKYKRIQISKQNLKELKHNDLANKDAHPSVFGYEEYAATVHFVMNMAALEDALESECNEKWKEAADNEFTSLMDNET